MKKSSMLLKGLAVALFILAIPVISVAQMPAQSQVPFNEQAPAPVQVQEPKPAPAQTQSWKLYMETETRKYYFDPASIQYPAKRIVRVWERITEVGKGDQETEKVKSLIDLDCGSSNYRIIATKEYDPATQTEKPEVRNENEPWTYFLQETILGILYDNVCYKSTMKKTDQKSKTEEKPKGK